MTALATDGTSANALKIANTASSARRRRAHAVAVKRWTRLSRPSDSDSCVFISPASRCLFGCTDMCTPDPRALLRVRAPNFSLIRCSRGPTGSAREPVRGARSSWLVLVLGVARSSRGRPVRQREVRLAPGRGRRKRRTRTCATCGGLRCTPGGRDASPLRAVTGQRNRLDREHRTLCRARRSRASQGDSPVACCNSSASVVGVATACAKR